ncbi:hypothetical protein JOF45_001666 [Nesterenkonia lacusekhoensis]|uniref:Uncharacterized protein n=1 Tax=Nesterenkonia lacusekhoensis TaxID=150832 RepID=A0ABS4T2I0_9MICC|nr:hypothetical protein [Nesterenkonia lacusekhoensis]MBP2318647.1 hypothetical protein [Nesterenkonia lacusekhoensis]
MVVEAHVARAEVALVEGVPSLVREVLPADQRLLPALGAAEPDGVVQRPGVEVGRLGPSVGCRVAAVGLDGPRLAVLVVGQLGDLRIRGVRINSAQVIAGR